MKNHLKEQFDNLRAIIRKNIDLLISLIRQSDHLADLIKKISDLPENKELQYDLEGSKNKIRDSINSLIEQTEKLFKVYDKLFDEIFG